MKDRRIKNLRVRLVDYTISILVDAKIYLMGNLIPQLQKKVKGPFSRLYNLTRNKIMLLEVTLIMILKISLKSNTPRKIYGITL